MFKFTPLFYFITVVVHLDFYIVNYCEQDNDYFTA